MPANFTPEQIAALQKIVKEAVAEVVRQELAAAGLRVEIGDAQDEARADFMFLRRFRRAFDSTASKIGGAIIMGAVGGVLWLIVEGFKALR